MIAAGVRETTSHPIKVIWPHDVSVIGFEIQILGILAHAADLNLCCAVILSTTPAVIHRWTRTLFLGWLVKKYVIHHQIYYVRIP